jgi:hypothetical protein
VRTGSERAREAVIQPPLLAMILRRRDPKVRCSAARYPSTGFASFAFATVVQVRSNSRNSPATRCDSDTWQPLPRSAAAIRFSCAGSA